MTSSVPIALVAAIALVASTLLARSADEPTPRPSCSVVRSYVEQLGERLAMSVAKARGLSESQIRRIRVECNMPEKK